MEQLKHDTAAAVDFLRRWSPEDDWCLTAIVPNGKTETRTFRPSEANDAADWIEAHQGKRNLYFTCNKVRRSMGLKPSKQDIASFRAFWIDLDPRAGEPLGEERQRIETLLTTGLPEGVPKPSAVVFSGGGYQAFWLLAEPLAISAPTDDTLEPWTTGEAYNRALERIFSSDAVHNCDRLMRLPGTINVPTKKKVAKGREPELACVIVENWDSRYALSDFESLKRAQPTSTAPRLATQASSAEVDLGDSTGLPSVGAQELQQWAEANGKTVGDETLKLIATGEASKWDGDRSKMVFKVCCDLVRAGVPDRMLGGLLLDPRNVAFYAHFKDQKTNRLQYAKRQIERARSAVAKDAQRAGGAVMWDRTNQHGDPLPSYWNARSALQLMGVECRYDKFRDRHLVGSHELQEFAGDFSDHAERILRDEIIRRFSFDPGDVNTNKAVLSLCTENRFDSLIDHLNALPPWDGTPRLDTWLVDYLGADDNPYTHEAGAAWLTAAVVRAFEPGTKFDYMLVLEGATGLGKSAALRLLATGTTDRTCNERFSDAAFLGARDAREVLEVTTGAWILECAELDGMSRRDVETLKAMITRQEDKGRPAYARSAVTVPRRFVLAGTTNEDRYLHDPTGNRRFWPVIVERVDLEGLHTARDQLIAESLTRYRSGQYRLPLSQEAEAWAKKEQDRRRVVDVGYMEQLHDLSEVIQEGRGQWAGYRIVTNDAVYNRLNLSPDKRVGKITKQVKAAMRALGWTSVEKTVKVNGKPCFIYAREQASSTADDAEECYGETAENMPETGPPF